MELDMWVEEVNDGWAMERWVVEEVVMGEWWRVGDGEVGGGGWVSGRGLVNGGGWWVCK
jgi:hypothetical protein